MTLLCTIAFRVSGRAGRSAGRTRPAINSESHNHLHSISRLYLLQPAAASKMTREIDSYLPPPGIKNTGSDLDPRSSNTITKNRRASGEGNIARVAGQSRAKKPSDVRSIRKNVGGGEGGSPLRSNPREEGKERRWKCLFSFQQPPPWPRATTCTRYGLGGQNSHARRRPGTSTKPKWPETRKR